MHLTTLSHLFLAMAVVPALSMPAPAPEFPSSSDTHFCHNHRFTTFGGDASQVLKWELGALGVNKWDQHKFSRELNIHACAATEMKSNYDENTKAIGATFTTSGACTAGRVTDSFRNSAGLFHLDW